MEGVARNDVIGELPSMLDCYRERLSHVQCVAIVDEMIRNLAVVYDGAMRAGALPEFRAACQMHPLHDLVLQDPFTERGFRKPNGDGVMFDYIHRPRRLALTDVGAAVHFVTTGMCTAKSLRWRRDHIGAQIVKTVKRKRNAGILWVAGGHLRELDVVARMVSRRDFEIVALDPDRESLVEAVNSNADFNVVPVHKPFSHLLSGEGRATYDLILAPAMLDSLPDGAASILLGRLIDRLAPSGRLIAGNHAPGNYDRGYVEGMMGWALRYRTEADLKALLPRDGTHRLYRDKPGNAIYLDFSARS